MADDRPLPPAGDGDRPRRTHGDAITIIEPRDGATLMKDAVDFVLYFDTMHSAYPPPPLPPPPASTAGSTTTIPAAA